MYTFFLLSLKLGGFAVIKLAHSKIELGVKLNRCMYTVWKFTSLSLCVTGTLSGHIKLNVKTQVNLYGSSSHGSDKHEYVYSLL